MLTTLQTSYTDTRAGDLAWQLGGEPLPALAVRDLRLGGLDDALAGPGGHDGHDRHAGADQPGNPGGPARPGSAGGPAGPASPAGPSDPADPSPRPGPAGLTRFDDRPSGTPGGLIRGTLQLRLLGASHQVILAAGPGECLETVACLPGRRTPLPARVAEQVAGWEYEFAARIEELPPHVFAARAQELLALVEGHPRGLAGIFPGDPSAFTALVAHCEERRVLWRTWHAYPQEGRLVCTRSSLVVRGGDDVDPGTTGAW